MSVEKKVVLLPSNFGIEPPQVYEELIEGLRGIHATVSYGEFGRDSARFDVYQWLDSLPCRVDLLSVDSGTVVSWENMLVGVNWVVVPLVATGWGTREDLEVAIWIQLMHLKKLITAAMRVSGKTFRMLVLVQRIERREDAEWEYEWCKDAVESVKEVAMVYRAQGFPIAVVSVAEELLLREGEEGKEMGGGVKGNEEGEAAKRLLAILLNREGFCAIDEV